MLAWLLLLGLGAGAWANSVSITETWNGGFKGEACLDFTSDTSGGWTAHIKFDSPLTALETWAVTTSKEGDGKQWTVHNEAFNANEHSGDHMCFIFVARCNCGTIRPGASINLEGQGGGNTGGGGATQGPVNTPAPGETIIPGALPTAGHTGGGTAAHDYAKALQLSILFYDAQRSGKLPANNPIPWRDDSAMGDRGDGGEDLTGGWYDAGDHVKFNLPMASSTTVLLWGLLKFKDGYQAAGQLDMMYDMIKTPLDYFLKCWIPSKNTYYVQVGDGNQDHAFWGRPEDMHMNRPAYKLTEGQGGSDVTCETAAAMAAGSIAFKDKDAGYSGRLLDAAKSLYEFGKRNQGIYSNSVWAAKDYYGSTSFKDEMCEAAMWLYKATNEARYLNDAKGFHESDTGWALSWDDKKIACQLLLFEATQDGQYKQEVQSFMHDYMPGGSIPYTPCGLVYRNQWGATRYAGNAAFIALAAADDGIDSLTYRKWAQSQINYILGSNGRCQSFEIGYGSNFPHSPHHRGASCPNRPAPCNQGNLNNPGPSPQQLNGALVGGPDQGDGYNDSRGDYVHNEVACDYNSGFQSALAGLNHLVSTKDLPPADPPKCHC